MIKHDTNHIKTFRLNFSNPISFNEIPYLRGAIIKIGSVSLSVSEASLP